MNVLVQGEAVDYIVAAGVESNYPDSSLAPSEVRGEKQNPHE